MKVKVKPAAVQATIDRFRGQASHAGVVMGMMGVWLGRDLASAKAAADPAEQAELKRDLVDYYRPISVAHVVDSLV